jgi:RNA polymerase sigma-70 factor (ECF subfamily)
MQHAVRHDTPSVADLPRIEARREDYHYVRAILRRNGVNARDAEDLVQEVLLVMWRRRSDYDPSRPLRPWLGGIAVKVAASFRKRKTREISSDVIDARDGALDPEEELALNRSQRMVARALAALPEKLRTVLVLYDLEGHSMRDIAEELEVPLFTAYSRLRMARQSLGRFVRRLQQQTVASAEAARYGVRRTAARVG